MKFVVLVGTNVEIIKVHMYLNCQRSQKDHTVPHSGAFLGWMPYDLELTGNSQMVSGQGHDMLSGYGQSIYANYAPVMFIYKVMDQTWSWDKQVDG